MINLYRWLWTRIGGRPWTYIIRDFVHGNPWLFVLVALFTLLWFLHLRHEILCIMVGFLLGHLFWGTKYRKGQKGNGISGAIKH